MCIRDSGVSVNDGCGSTHLDRLENGKPVQEGYCLTCARELHIQPVDDLMKRFNMTDDQLASMGSIMFLLRRAPHRARPLRAD